MKREQFVIPGIPPGYEVWDVDLTPEGLPVCIITSPNDPTAEPRIITDAGLASIPQESFVKRVAAPFVFAPRVRCAGDRLVLVKPRADRDEMNAWIVNWAGDIGQSFHAGDGISEVLANDASIVVAYYDEGVFGDDPVSEEGLAFFDSKGTFQSGYASMRTKGYVEIYDCYCACWSGDGALVFYPYGEPNFPLVRLSLRDMSQQSWSTPEDLHGSNALTSVGDDVYFYSPYDIRSARTGRGDKIFRWKIGADTSELVGEYQLGGHLRGLPGGRFIAAELDGYTILSFD
jgi:hypothetical protein